MAEPQEAAKSRRVRAPRGPLRELVRVQGLHALIGAHEDHVGAAAGEQPVGHGAGDVVDLRFQLGRIEDSEVLDVENDVAVVRDEMLAQLGMSPELHELVGDMATSHGNHFDRQRVVSEHADELRLVDDADELLGHRRDDLFPGQRAASAFDHRSVRSRLVRAVDVDRQIVDRRQLDDGYAVAPEPLGGPDRARDRAPDAFARLRELVDEKVRGRAAADAEIRVLDDVPDRLAGDELLLFVLGHHFFRNGGRSVHTPSNSSAAKPIDSDSVGCGWIVLPMSVASAPISIASAISLTRSPACVPTMAPPTTRCVASSNRSLVKPSSRPLAMARPDAAQGKTAFRTFTPLAFASSSVSPTQATSGSVYATDGITRASKNDFSPAAASAATCPSCTALCASIGCPTMSPIAKMCGTLVRICASAGMKPRSVTVTPAFSAAMRLPLGLRPTESSTRS